MEFIKIILLFLVPANILLLNLLRYNHKKDIFLQVIWSYGVGPLVMVSFFYAMMRFFPGKNNVFYLINLGLFLIGSFLLGLKFLPRPRSLYGKIALWARNKIFISKNILFIPIVLIFVAFTIQLFAYPIIDGDNARYINQSKAIYKYRNIEWRKKDFVITDNKKEYRYNPMISPAIPYYTAMSFMIDDNPNNYFAYKFFAFYYYFLLGVLFLYVIYKMVDKTKKNISLIIWSSGVFFLFFWELTRGFIFGSKESSIYFLALLGLYIISKLTVIKKRDIFLEIILAITFGLNSFINIHGIIIGFISLLVLLISSGINILERFKQVLFIFLIFILTGAFELIRAFNFIFATTIKNSFIGSVFLNIFGNGKFYQINSAGYQIGYDKGHVELYQFGSTIDRYIKGKFQMFTNIGFFGIYAWLFVAVLFSNFKKIINTSIGRIVLLFLAIYFFIVIDPLNLNKHPFSVVLWGSAKYAKLIVLLSIPITVVFLRDFIYSLNRKIVQIKYIKIFLGLVAVIMILFRKNIIALMLKILLMTIPIYKDISFYQEKMTIVFYLILLSLFSFLIYLFFGRYNKKMAFNILYFAGIIFFIGAPFFIVPVGKVPLIKTLSYLGTSRKNKLEKVVNYGDQFKVYFYALDNLQPNSFIKTNFDELTIYNNYFRFTNRSNIAEFVIVRKPCMQDVELFRSGNVRLCKKSIN